MTNHDLQHHFLTNQKYLPQVNPLYIASVVHHFRSTCTRIGNQQSMHLLAMRCWKSTWTSKEVTTTTTTTRIIKWLPISIKEKYEHMALRNRKQWWNNKYFIFVHGILKWWASCLSLREYLLETQIEIHWMMGDNISNFKKTFFSLDWWSTPTVVGSLCFVI